MRLSRLIATALMCLGCATAAMAQAPQAAQLQHTVQHALASSGPGTETEFVHLAPIVSADSIAASPASCETCEAPTCGAPEACCEPACGAPAACCDTGCDSGCCDSGCDSACCDTGCCGLGCCDLCDCDLGEAFTLTKLLHGDCEPCVTVGGWVQFGYHGEDNGLFNSRPEEFALHQAWLYAEKVAEACTSPLGFRVDVMYGIDADDTQAFGNNPGRWDFDNGLDYGAYGWAIPQLYGEVALGDWSIKAGHFYTLVGYEVVTAPDNFFYSHAMTMYNSEPFTHTGVVGSNSLTDDLEIYAGWTLGWDTGFDQVNGGSSWLGGFSYSMSEDASVTYISTAGNFGARGDEAYSHSVVFDFTMTDNFNWVVQSDLLRVDATGEDNVGVNQYFLYTVNDCLGLGARLEWWKADGITGYAPHGGTAPGANDGSYSYYAATFGANIRKCANIVVRPEVRVDWSPAADYDEAYFGVDTILTF